MACLYELDSKGLAFMLMRTIFTKRLLVALVAMLSLLFMQLASAAYGCSQTLMGDVGSTTSVQTGYADCMHMDAAHPNLCIAQACVSSNVPLVHKLKASLHAASSQRTDLLPASSDTFASTPLMRPSPGLFRAISPPLSIRDCRFLI
ncbi:hypothetical protein [Castellaniella caeni]|uniref:hypothetical protein n=1 Tax=Castellaniella caeni TaxID=266123 RepID=UPI00082D37EE|nr:hypothetical protein [Castellaniella caeni]